MNNFELGKFYGLSWTNSLRHLNAFDLMLWEERNDFGIQCFLNCVTLINWGKPLGHQSGVVWSNSSLIAKAETLVLKHLIRKLQQLVAEV